MVNSDEDRPLTENIKFPSMHLSKKMKIYNKLHGKIGAVLIMLWDSVYF
jgi:hypothetical protein